MLLLEWICAVHRAVGWGDTSATLLTEYVGFDGQREVRVVSQDVDRFGDGDVLKVLAIDLHDLKRNRENE